MYLSLIPLLKRSPKHIILHVGSNDAINNTSADINQKILELRQFILDQLPESNVYISCPVLRTDDSKAHLTLV